MESHAIYYVNCIQDISSYGHEACGHFLSVSRSLEFAVCRFYCSDETDTVCSYRVKMNLL